MPIDEGTINSILGIDPACAGFDGSHKVEREEPHKITSERSERVYFVKVPLSRPCVSRQILNMQYQSR